MVVLNQSMGSNKNILFSTTSYSTVNNGPAYFIQLIANKIWDSNLNIDFRVLTENTHKKETNKVYHLDLKRTKWNRFLFEFIRIYRYHNEAKKIYSDFKFDTIVYNNAFTGLLSSIFFKQTVILMVNDYNKIDSHYKKLHKSLTITEIKFKLLYYLEKIALQKADITIVNSNYMKKLVIKEYNLPDANVKLLYKGIETKNYNFRLRNKFNPKIKILFLKTEYINGGLELVIKAISRLKIKENIILTIVGPDKNLRSKILNLSAKYNVLVDFKAQVNPHKIIPIIDESDLLCVTPFNEALGVVYMEALASGLPVISSKVGGIPEVLNNGKAGWMITKASPDTLAETIKICIENNDLRAKKSMNGRIHVKKFESKILLDNFINILINS